MQKQFFVEFEGEFIPQSEANNAVLNAYFSKDKEAMRLALENPDVNLDMNSEHAVHGENFPVLNKVNTAWKLGEWTILNDEFIDILQQMAQFGFRVKDEMFKSIIEPNNTFFTFGKYYDSGLVTDDFLRDFRVDGLSMATKFLLNGDAYMVDRAFNMGHKVDWSQTVCPDGMMPFSMAEYFVSKEESTNNTSTFSLFISLDNQLKDLIEYEDDCFSVRKYLAKAPVDIFNKLTPDKFCRLVKKAFDLDLFPAEHFHLAGKEMNICDAVVEYMKKNQPEFFMHPSEVTNSFRQSSISSDLKSLVSNQIMLSGCTPVKQANQELVVKMLGHCNPLYSAFSENSLERFGRLVASGLDPLAPFELNGETATLMACADNSMCDPLWREMLQSLESSQKAANLLDELGLSGNATLKPV